MTPGPLDQAAQRLRSALAHGTNGQLSPHTTDVRVVDAEDLRLLLDALDRLAHPAKDTP